MKNIFLLILCPMLVGCLKLKKKGADAEAEQTPRVYDTSDLSDPRYVFEATELANVYRVKFKLGEDWAGNVRIEKKVGGVTKSVNDISVDISHEFLITLGDPGAESTFEFSTIVSTANGPQVKVLKNFKLKEPQDLLVRYRRSLKSVLAEYKVKSPVKEFKRIYFEKDAVLMTDGENLDLHADEVYFDNATIQSFEKSAAAMPGQAGRSGGLVQIHARKISGHVNFILNGEHGGQGDPGLPPTPSMNGKNGTPGKSAVGNFQVRACENFCTGAINYQSQPTNGNPGTAGRKGFRGGAGKNGGASGSLIINAKISTQFSYNLENNPGWGGDGGAGGEGGYGGNGGTQGSCHPGLDPDSVAAQRESKAHYEGCIKAVRGEDGARGDQGDSGEKGKDGLLSQTCIRTDLIDACN